jgi:hypothetical protein
MTIFTSSMFPNISYDLPEGGGSPAHANDSVTLQLSDGNIVTVCDTVSTALKLLAYMRQNSQWQVLASDDVSVVSINAVKALVMENTITNQKLLTQYLPTYIVDQVRFVHRTSSLVLSLTDALKSVGFCHTGGLPFSNNLDLRLGSAHMQLVDWNYKASPATSSEGSLLNDGVPLRYDFTAQ